MWTAQYDTVQYAVHNSNSASSKDIAFYMRGTLRTDSSECVSKHVSQLLIVPDAITPLNPQLQTQAHLSVTVRLVPFNSAGLVQYVVAARATGLARRWCTRAAELDALR